MTTEDYSELLKSKFKELDDMCTKAKEEYKLDVDVEIVNRPYSRFHDFGRSSYPEGTHKITIKKDF